MNVIKLNAVLSLICLFTSIRIPETNGLISDINHHHLQYISDHLVQTDCLVLVRSLHRASSIITHITKLEPSSGEDVREPCIKKLLRWHRTRAGKKNDYMLDMRLKQLQHRKVAVYIARNIAHEKSNNLKNEVKEVVGLPRLQVKRSGDALRKDEMDRESSLDQMKERRLLLEIAVTMGIIWMMTFTVVLFCVVQLVCMLVKQGKDEIHDEEHKKEMLQDMTRA